MSSRLGAMPTQLQLPQVAATRYVTPLREGGSMPGLMEADDDGLYVVKFRGAGQGPLALVAELICGELIRAAGLATPRLALVDVDTALGAAEPDSEIQELILASPGLNVGSDFLPGAVTYTSTPEFRPVPDLAAEVVWLDALLTNVDRTPRNPNLLIWHDELHLIDHGAALYLQHAGLAGKADRNFPQIAEHVLLPVADSVAEAGERVAARLTGEVVETVVAAVPVEWFENDPPAAYVQYLLARIARATEIGKEADDAR